MHYFPSEIRNTDRPVTRIFFLPRQATGASIRKMFTLHKNFSNVTFSQKVSLIFTSNVDFYARLPRKYAKKFHIGAIHLWRPHEGGGLRWTHVDGGRGSSPMWTSTQKIKIRVHWRHTLFFSCKEVGVLFTRIWCLDRKKVEIFLRYKLVI